MAKYATGTDVPVSRSKQEIENLMTRFGCVRFASISEPQRAPIMPLLTTRGDGEAWVRTEFSAELPGDEPYCSHMIAPKCLGVPWWRTVRFRETPEEAADAHAELVGYLDAALSAYAEGLGS